MVGVVDSELTSAPVETANRLADLPAFQPQPSSDEAELQLHVDYEHGVAYILLASAAGLLSRAPAVLGAESDAAAHAWLTDRSSERALVVLFHLCHVILVVQRGRAADVRLLRTLRVAATLKQNLHPAVTAALKPLAGQLPPHRAGTPPLLPPLPTLGFVFASDLSLSKSEALQVINY